MLAVRESGSDRRQQLRRWGRSLQRQVRLADACICNALDLPENALLAEYLAYCSSNARMACVR